MLLGLANDIDGLRHVEPFAGHADGGVDQGDMSFGELAVHGRSGHLDYFALYHSVGAHISLYSAAAAPLTTSMISLVMLAWRTRFIYKVSLSIISAALEVAASMAVMRAACSAAADSSSAR